MPSQKSPKPTSDLTTEEAMRRLFPKPVIRDVQRKAHEEPVPKKRDPKVMP